MEGFWWTCPRCHIMHWGTQTCDCKVGTADARKPLLVKQVDTVIIVAIPQDTPE